jgi:hypothetical protein
LNEDAKHFKVKHLSLKERFLSYFYIIFFA